MVRSNFGTRPYLALRGWRYKNHFCDSIFYLIRETKSKHEIKVPDIRFLGKVILRACVLYDSTKTSVSFTVVLPRVSECFNLGLGKVFLNTR